VASRADVVLLPGFGGTAEQPLLVKLSTRLEALGFACRRLAPPRGKLTPGLEREVAWLVAALEDVKGPHVLVGRSFGARVCARRAGAPGVAACVLLGYPLRPPGKPRPLDEVALSGLACPTLLVQGSDDELGPMPVVRQAIAANSHVTLEVLDGAGHSFGRAERGALDRVAAWLDGRVG
jgi:predicted alpha/beta-hydrolase family hydrolase